MKKGEFIDFVESVRPHLYGKGQEIAEMSGVSYLTYHNYIQGAANAEETRIKIASSIKKKLKDMVDDLLPIVS